MVIIQKAFGLLTAIFFTIGVAAASPPAMTFSEADAVSTTDAKAYFLNDVDGNARGTVRTSVTSFAYQNTQIEALADALENDPELMFQFVRNNIDLHPVFGVSKGSFGAMLDMEGSAFDQVELLARLLDYADTDAGTLSYSVRVGDVSICNSELEAWTGTTGSLASDILVQGGIPVDGTVPDGGSECSSNLTIGHAWLEVDVGSGPEIWDPAYKVYTNPSARDFNSMSGYTAGAAVLKASQNAGAGTDANGVPFVEGVSSVNLATELNARLTSLQAEFSNLNGAAEVHDSTEAQRLASVYDKRLEDLIGVSRIDLKPTQALNKSPLAYYSSWHSDGLLAFPDQYRVEMIFRIVGNGGARFGGDVSLYADEVFGRPFRLQARSNDADNQMEACASGAQDGRGVLGFAIQPSFENRYCLALMVGKQHVAVQDIGVLLLTHIHDINVKIDHPYAAGSSASATFGGYADSDYFYWNQSVISDVVFVNGFGQTSETVLGELEQLIGIDNAPPGPGFPGIEEDNPGYSYLGSLANNTGPASNAVRYKLGASWLVQASRMRDFTDGLSNSRSLNHKTFGLAASNVILRNPREQTFPPPTGDFGLAEQRGWSIGDESLFVDLRPDISVAADDMSILQTVKRVHAAIGAVLESAIFAHVMGAVDTNSTGTKFEFAAGPSSSRSRVEPADYHGSSVRFSYFAPNIDCSNIQMQAGEEINQASLITVICNLTSEGQAVVAPQSAGLGPGPLLASTVGYRYPQSQGTSLCGSTTVTPIRLRDLSGDNLTQAELDNFRIGCLHQDPLACVGAHPFWQPTGIEIFDALLAEEFTMGMTGGDIVGYIRNADVHACAQQPDANPEPIRITSPHPDRGGALVTWDAGGAGISHLLVNKFGVSKGGATDVSPGEITAHKLPTEDDILGQNGGESPYYSVDAKTGLVTVTTGDILSTGAGEGALSFSRSMQSGPRGAKEPLWSHNWNIRANISSSGLEAMGATRVEAAAPTIISIMAMLDLYSVSDAQASPEEIIKREVVGPLVAAWWQKQTLHNLVTISRGTGSEKFVRLENATYAPVAGRKSELLVSGEPRIIPRKHVDVVGPSNLLDPFTYGFDWKYDQISFTHRNERQDETSFAYREVLDLDPWDAKVRDDRVENWGYQSFWLPEQTLFSAGGELTYNLVGDSQQVVSGTIENSFGRSISFTKTSATDGDGRTVNFTEDSVTFLDGETVQYGFEVYLKEIDVYQSGPNGVGAQLEADKEDYVLTEGQAGVRFVGVKSITQPGYTPGSTINTAQFEYDAMGKISSVTNARDQTWDYASAMGRRSSVTNPQGNSPFTLYDDNGNGYYSSDGYQFATFGTFDGIGRALETRVGILAYGPEYYYARSTYLYDQASNPIVEEAHTRIATTTGANAFKTYREIYPTNSNYDPIRTVRTYDPTFNVLISEVDGVGTTTVLNTLDSVGRVESTLGPSGELTEYVWNGPFGQLSSSVTKLNATESLQTDFNYLSSANYFQLDNVAVDPSGENVVTSMTYDEFGRLVSVTDALGNTTSAEYDVMGRMLEIRDAIGGGADYDYYPNGKLKQLKQLKDGGGTANSLIEYSVTGKPLRVVSPDGAETNYVYDFRDWLRDVVDPDGLLTRRVYQPDGRVQRIEKANDTSVHQIEARFWYNYDGSMQRLRPARGNQAPQSQTYDTTYWLDHFGRPDTIISFADGSVQSSPLYADGTVRYSRLRKQTPANNEWDYIYFEYDASKRLTKQRERHRGRSPEWRDTKEFTYDLAGRLLREFETGDDYTFDAGVDEEVVFDYDKLGRVKSETQNGRTVAYQYDKLGNRKRMTWPDGMSVDYDYDALNRLDSVRFGSNALVDYSYDLRGRMKTADFQNGTVTNFTFNNDNQMEGLGYVLKDEQGLAETLSWAHGYTPAGRLSQTNLLDNKHPSWAPSVAELISYAAPSLPGEAANELDQYEQVSRNLVSKPYAYDDRGNLTSVGLTVSADYTNYQYSFENRLVSGTRGTTSFAYDYDVSGRRVGKIVDGLESRFLYAGDMEIAEYDAAGTVLRRYIPGGAIDSRVAYIEGAGTSLSDFKYYHADRLGNVAALSDAAGNVSDRYAYDPFGNEVTGAGLGGQLFRYTGRKFDPETGLYFYRARYYDPDLGRFLSTDPIGYADQWNLYTYVGNDPLNATDPSGMAIEDYTGNDRGAVERLTDLTIESSRYSSAIEQPPSRLKHNREEMNSEIINALSVQTQITDGFAEQSGTTSSAVQIKERGIGDAVGEALTPFVNFVAPGFSKPNSESIKIEGHNQFEITKVERQGNDGQLFAPGGNFMGGTVFVNYMAGAIMRVDNGGELQNFDKYAADHADYVQSWVNQHSVPVIFRIHHNYSTGSMIKTYVISVD